MQFPTNPSWGLLRAFVVWSSPILAEVPLGAVPRQFWIGTAVGFLEVAPR